MIHFCLYFKDFEIISSRSRTVKWWIPRKTRYFYAFGCSTMSTIFRRFADGGAKIATHRYYSVTGLMWCSRSFPLTFKGFMNNWTRRWPALHGLANATVELFYSGMASQGLASKSDTHFQSIRLQAFLSPQRTSVTHVWNYQLNYLPQRAEILT